MTGDKVEKDKMVFADLSDLEMASKVRMLMRTDLDHEAVCVGARDRIMYLSQKVEEMGQDICEDCDNGWKEDRAGRYACACVTERGPFGHLYDMLEKIKRVATGEDQVADDDTDGLTWIADYITKGLGSV